MGTSCFRFSERPADSHTGSGRGDRDGVIAVIQDEPGDAGAEEGKASDAETNGEAGIEMVAIGGGVEVVVGGVAEFVVFDEELVLVDCR